MKATNDAVYAADSNIPDLHGHVVQHLSALGFHKFTTTGLPNGGMIAVVHKSG